MCRTSSALTPFRGLFLSSAHANPAHLAVIGGGFLLESVVRCAAFVRCPKIGGFSVFGNKLREKQFVHPRWSIYTEDVRY